MVFQKTIGQVVNENYIYARALHYLGVDFFESADRSLKEVCLEKGLNRQRVIKSFYEFDACNRVSFKELETYPIELLTAYLKHAHHVFIKDKLPYIIHLLKRWKREDGLDALLAEFVEDFIRHIYEEEDTLFKYIDTLCQQKKSKTHASFELFMQYDRFSLEREFEEHKDEDEFGGIRQLMASFEPSNLHERVLLYEINSFDREMIYHAEIENEIFFPKAIELEAETKKQIQLLSRLN